MKDRSVWRECRDANAHERCAGSNSTSECICWHHIVQQRQVEHALELLVQTQREVASICARLGVELVVTRRASAGRDVLGL